MAVSEALQRVGRALERITSRIPVWRWTRVWLQSSFLPAQNYLIILAVVVGVLTGLGSVGFIYALQSVAAFARGPVASLLERFGTAQLVLLPALGGLMVGPIVQRFAKEAKGHGVPEVMTALARHGGHIRKRVVSMKVIASSLTIGFGGTAGREGPMVQIGAAIGSTIGQWTRLTPNELRTLVSCGAAGGVAATFNAPIAAAIFSMEVLIGRIRTDFLLVLLTSLSSCLVARYFLGNFPAFMAPTYSLVSPAEVPLYFLMGTIMGVAATGYVRLLYRSEDLFGRWQFPEWLKPAVGGLLVGLVLRFFPEVYGSSFDAIESALWVRVRRRPALVALRRRADRQLRDARVRRIGRGVRAQSLHGGDAGGRVRILCARDVPGVDGWLRRLRDGGDGGVLRRDREGADDGDPYPVRDDERLPDHAAADGSSGGERLHLAPLLAVQHLHAAAASAGHPVPLR